MDWKLQIVLTGVYVLSFSYLFLGKYALSFVLWLTGVYTFSLLV